MSIPTSRAPHIEGASVSPHSAAAPNAALLIDFDNVTMGMRSDLSKELKTLLGADVIKGKVTVQRAYADWRRYPQYIVPLSEASIDLIFAPAYGSSKKNATDIRMAIDGIELVFTRPEIGTYILLTGDSDFSSLVLKLKEYGKYVIGVGLQESSSDILVQNCDEYYSYTSLAGLRKADEGGSGPSDPWSLVTRATEKMGRRGDVMRSDRLKQVMLELDPAFDEKGLGFNKFSRFVSEASRRGILQIRRMENGQFEISAKDGEEPAEEPTTKPQHKAGAAPSSGPPAANRNGLSSAYTLLNKAVAELLDDADSDSVRDSDVKRRMLALERGFDENAYGFPKFSRFLQKAHDDGVIELSRSEGGHFEVTPGAAKRAAAAAGPLDPEKLRLPTGRESVVKYLTNSYGGVGKRTAEALVDALGDQLFPVLQNDPSKVEALLPPARAERVLAGWRADYSRRERHARENDDEATPVATAATSGPAARASTPPDREPAPAEASPAPPQGGARRGRRTRGSFEAEG